MSPAAIADCRARLEAFLAGGAGSAPVLELVIDSPPARRIADIYAIVFPGWKKARFYGRFFLARLARAVDWSPLKVFLYRRTGMQIGRGVFLSPDVILDPHFPELIEIGDYAVIGWGSHLFTHEFSGSRYRVGRIKVGAGAVIGGFSIVRGGVVIGDNAEIASTCIVYKDVPENYYLDSAILLNRALLEVYREEVRRA